MLFGMSRRATEIVAELSVDVLRALNCSRTSLNASQLSRMLKARSGTVVQSLLFLQRQGWVDSSSGKYGWFRCAAELDTFSITNRGREQLQ
jgi:DNA-binding IclR family transcriptional regulator